MKTPSLDELSDRNLTACCDLRSIALELLKSSKILLKNKLTATKFKSQKKKKKPSIA